MADGALVDMTGQRVGRLTVIERGEDHTLPNGKRRPRWRCLCDCGNTTLVMGQNLRSKAKRGIDYSCGCLQRELMALVGRSNHKGADITYNTAHKRVRRARGRARGYPCADCRARAAEWSYDHRDPDERSQVVRRRGKTTLMTYSVDVDHYEPRCHDCHRAFDRGR